jgi:hypothetical protein
VFPFVLSERIEREEFDELIEKNWGQKWLDDQTRRVYYGGQSGYYTDPQDEVTLRVDDHHFFKAAIGYRVRGKRFKPSTVKRVQSLYEEGLLLSDIAKQTKVPYYYILAMVI